MSLVVTCGFSAFVAIDGDKTRRTGTPDHRRAAAGIGHRASTFRRLTPKPPAITTKKVMIFRISWSERQDSNLRPLRPERIDSFTTLRTFNYLGRLHPP